MWAIEGDAEAVRYQSFEPRTLEECQAYIEHDIALRSPERRRFDLAVTLVETGRLVGRVGLDVKAPEHRIGELWFILDRAFWGRGLMPEAARRLVDFGFHELDLRRIFIDCDPRNVGAIRLAEKLGMIREGHLRECVFVKGEWCDSLFFGVLAREWRATHSEHPSIG
jgi:RimJ/RimL family protein N-acetyltransferase